MSLSREQMLDEMGLAPQWKLREQASVARGAKKTPERASIAAAASVVDEVSPPPVSFQLSVEERTESSEHKGWAELRQSVAVCRACALCAERKQTVFGVGDENADWLFIGEGPGVEEDEQGEPFVGPAGKLLDAMLSAIDLKRGENVYIANAVKCHPPGNHTPKEAEITACAPYLKRQIALLQPKLIVLLGRTAVHAVLGENESLASLRGKALTYCDGEQSIPVVVTYHPSYLLRTLPDKAKSWEDLCRARKLMI